MVGRRTHESQLLRATPRSLCTGTKPRSWQWIAPFANLPRVLTPEMSGEGEKHQDEKRGSALHDDLCRRVLLAQRQEESHQIIVWSKWSLRSLCATPTPRHSSPNRAHPTTQAQHSTTQHRTTEPPNHATPNTRPNTQDPNTQHPNTQPNTRPITPPKGGAGRPPEERGAPPPPKGGGGVNSRLGRTPNWREWSEKRCQKGVRANHHRREERGSGGEPPLKEEVGEGNHHPTGRRGGEGANHRLTERWTEFIPMSFHFTLKSGTAAPPREGRGRKHHPKEVEGGEGTTSEKKGGTSSPLLFWWCSLHSLPWGGVFFPCLPLGGADFLPLPCWVVPFPFLSKNITKNELTFVRLTEVKFSSVEWWSLFLPFGGPAFLGLLLGGAAGPPPSFGRVAFLLLL